MRVLSLFDGMSGGQEALRQAGVEVTEYYACEIEPFAMKVAKHNFPDMVHLGDVRELDIEEMKKKGIDILIGGSPCQSFSMAGKKKGMVGEKEGVSETVEITTLEDYLKYKEEGFEFAGQSYLFWEYVRILRGLKPKYFLLENVKMSSKWEKILTAAMGVAPILLDGGDFSAQSRPRLFWTNIPLLEYEKSEVIISDIIEEGVENVLQPKRQEYTQYDVTNLDFSKYEHIAVMLGQSKQFGGHSRANGKAFTVRRAECNGYITKDGKIHRYTPLEVERLFNFPDGYTAVEGVTQTARYEMLGNGWEMGTLSHIFKGIVEEEKQDKEVEEVAS